MNEKPDCNKSPLFWRVPAEARATSLIDNEIQVWLADLRQSAHRVAELAMLLTADEQKRAAQYRFPVDRDRFIAGRGLLRELLGRYLNRSAATLRFEQGPHGKPVVAGLDSQAGLHFNLSHSGHGMLLAIAHRELGVDIERLGRPLNPAPLIERVCTPRERAWLQSQTQQEQEAFLACWTRKEAIAKALGGGLSSGLRTLEVCLQDERQPEDGRACLRDASGRIWSVLNLPLAPGWCGALAALGPEWGWQGGYV